MPPCMTRPPTRGPPSRRRCPGRRTTVTSSRATRSDEYGEVAHAVFDPKRSRWAELPDDPLPRTFDRFMVPVGHQLVLAGSSSAVLNSGEKAPKLAARLDLDTRKWTPLPDARGRATS